MGLARIKSRLADVLVRRLGDSGGTKRVDVEAELDSLIAWAKDAPRVIHRDFVQVGNSGTGLDNLMSYTVPAATLATDNDFLIVHAAGNIAANNDDKRLVVSWNSTVLLDTALIDLDTFAWQITWIIGRQSATTIAASVQGVLGNVSIDSAGGIGSNGFTSKATNVNASAANNLGSSTNAITFQGESGSATNNNITQNALIVYLVQQ